MLKKKDIVTGLVKTVIAAALSVCVLFSCVPQIVNADKKSDDPTENREGFAAYLYDNTTLRAAVPCRFPPQIPTLRLPSPP